MWIARDDIRQILRQLKQTRPASTQVTISGLTSAFEGENGERQKKREQHSEKKYTAFYTIPWFVSLLTAAELNLGVLHPLAVRHRFNPGKQAVTGRTMRSIFHELWCPIPTATGYDEEHDQRPQQHDRWGICRVYMTDTTPRR